MRGEAACCAKQFKGMCRCCGEIGHKKADCPKHLEKCKIDGGQQGIKCWNCGETGHIASKCAKKNEQAKNAMLADEEGGVLDIAEGWMQGYKLCEY